MKTLPSGVESVAGDGVGVADVVAAADLLTVAVGVPDIDTGVGVTAAVRDDCGVVGATDGVALLEGVVGATEGETVLDGVVGATVREGVDAGVPVFVGVTCARHGDTASSAASSRPSARAMGAGAMRACCG